MMRASFEIDSYSILNVLRNHFFIKKYLYNEEAWKIIISKP